MQREPVSFSDHPALERLAGHALAAGTPKAVVGEAVRATAARFPRRAEGGRVPRARIEAYFWGVVRRRALQGAAPAVSRRLVIDSLERELREAGHTPEAIRSELTRLYGESACAMGTGGRVA
ncbi:MAG TPA: hypothetical protein VIL15_04475 [Coriobacteriia bacterium]